MGAEISCEVINDLKRATVRFNFRMNGAVLSSWSCGSWILVEEEI